ncbi:MAG TPA: bifunctional phosphoglucose/phosphomannose isomerase [Anaerolineae bacterium]|nr:bifunctional phosphoglucose/phosphomannose isomerase [Anaerolineae bacterium]
MIDLNDAQAIRARDPEGMLRHIAGLPDQCEAAWRDAQAIELPESFREARQVVIAGMGGSAIGGALFQSLAAPQMRIPVHVVRDYTLPAFAEGPSTLVIASSHSGDTEETLAAFQEARARRCQLIAIAGGGRLEAMARQFGAPFMRVAYESMPRAALGYSFVPLAAFASRLGWLDDPSAHPSTSLRASLREAAAVMREWNAELVPESPVVKNLAKRMAGQMVGRFVIVYGAGLFAEVARRWKGQVNENGKQFAAFEALPEADHNAILGSSYPEGMANHLKVIFLTGVSDHPRNRARVEISRQVLMVQGYDTDVLTARGESLLAQMLSLIQLGDWISGYLGIANGVDPSDTELLLEFKQRMAELG